MPPAGGGPSGQAAVAKRFGLVAVAEPGDEVGGGIGRCRAMAIASSRLADGVAMTERWTDRVNRRNVVAFIAPYLVSWE